MQNQMRRKKSLQLKMIALAGAASILGHDAVTTPLGTVKKRMQLGHYQDMR